MALSFLAVAEARAGSDAHDVLVGGVGVVVGEQLVEGVQGLQRKVRSLEGQEGQFRSDPVLLIVAELAVVAQGGCLGLQGQNVVEGAMVRAQEPLAGLEVQLLVVAHGPVVLLGRGPDCSSLEGTVGGGEEGLGLLELVLVDNDGLAGNLVVEEGSEDAELVLALPHGLLEHDPLVLQVSDPELVAEQGTVVSSVGEWVHEGGGLGGEGRTESLEVAGSFCMRALRASVQLAETATDRLVFQAQLRASPLLFRL